MKGRELERLAALLVEEEVNHSNNQAGDDQQGAGVGHPGEVVDSVLDGLAVSGDQAGLRAWISILMARSSAMPSGQRGLATPKIAQP